MHTEVVFAQWNVSLALSPHLLFLPFSGGLPFAPLPSQYVMRITHSKTNIATARVSSSPMSNPGKPEGRMASVCG